MNRSIFNHGPTLLPIGNIIANHPESGNIYAKDLLSENEKQQINSRITDLGISHIVDHETGKFQGRYEEVLNTIENALLKSAKVLKKKKIFKTTTKDAKKALNFLELFCLYAHTRAALTNDKKGDALFGKTAGTIFSLEQINNALDLPQARKLCKIHFNPTSGRINKLFSTLSATDQKAFLKELNTAQSILKRYSA